MSGEPSTKKSQQFDLDTLKILRNNRTSPTNLENVLGTKGLSTKSLLERSTTAGGGLNGFQTPLDTLTVPPSKNPILQRKPVDLSKIFKPSPSRLATDPSKPESPWLPTTQSPLRNQLGFPDYSKYPAPTPTPAPAVTAPPAEQKPETKP